MKYRVVAYIAEDHSVDDECICDTWEEAADLAVNWSFYYDVGFENLDGPEVFVVIEDLDTERSLIDG